MWHIFHRKGLISMRKRIKSSMGFLGDLLGYFSSLSFSHQPRASRVNHEAVMKMKGHPIIHCFRGKHLQVRSC